MQLSGFTLENDGGGGALIWRGMGERRGDIWKGGYSSEEGEWGMLLSPIPHFVWECPPPWWSGEVSSYHPYPILYGSAPLYDGAEKYHPITGTPFCMGEMSSYHWDPFLYGRSVILSLGPLFVWECPYLPWWSVEVSYKIGGELAVVRRVSPVNCM